MLEAGLVPVVRVRDADREVQHRHHWVSHQHRPDQLVMHRVRLADVAASLDRENGSLPIASLTFSSCTLANQTTVETGRPSSRTASVLSSSLSTAVWSATPVASLGCIPPTEQAGGRIRT